MATTSDTPRRRDAARNRRLILRTARAMVDAGVSLQLNAVAQQAEVGVGTVYRHFPTPEDLLAALAEERYESLIDLARQAAAAPDPRAGLRTFLERSLTAYVADPALAAEAAGPAGTTERTRALREQLQREVQDVLAVAGTQQRGIGPDDMMLLLCGVAYAVKHNPHPDDPDVARRYLNALLDGVLPAPKTGL